MCSARVCVCVCGGGGARVHSLDGCEKNSKVSKGVVFVFVFFWRGEPASQEPSFDGPGSDEVTTSD